MDYKFFVSCVFVFELFLVEASVTTATNAQERCYMH